MAPWQKTLVWCAAAAAAGGCTTLGGWRLLRPRDTAPRVSFDSFMSEVRSGRVTDVGIDGNEYTFTERGDDERAVREIAIGPTPDIALVSRLRPDDAEEPPPRVSFVR